MTINPKIKNMKPENVNNRNFKVLNILYIDGIFLLPLENGKTAKKLLV